MKKSSLLLLLAFFTCTLSAQRSLTEGAFANGRFSVAAELGFSRWNGDFHPTTDQLLNGIISSPLLGLSAEYNLSPYLGVGVMLGTYFLNQSDNNETHFSRGVYAAPYVSTDLLGVLNAEKLKRWSLWANVGVGMINPIRTRYSRTGTESPVLSPPAVLMIPWGLTLERKISPAISLGLSARFNTSNSDELDGVVRGDFNDHFQTLGLQVRYRILPDTKQHYRDEKFIYLTPAIRAINENIDKIEALQRKVEELEAKVKELEK